MSDSGSGEAWYLSVVSGKQQGAGASISRAIFAVAEPVYSRAMLARNLLYSRRLLKAAHADRPVVSVGNLTTGGTGKTPIVAWLADRLRAEGRKPAVLLRGYKAHQGISDEEALLAAALGSDIPVHAGANRYASSIAVTKENPTIDVFVLDDGFQHRKLARHFDLVLIDATAPFGFDRVLPRGLLREPIRALRRASAVVITRTSLADSNTLAEIEKRIHAEQPEVQLFKADFVQDRLIDNADKNVAIESLRGKKFFAFCGIGNPDSFIRQLQISGGEHAGSWIFPDHHVYTTDEVSKILQGAKSTGAQFVLTTEKDWTKLGKLSIAQSSTQPPILRVGLSVRFEANQGDTLVQQIVQAMEKGDQILGWRGTADSK